MALGVWPLWLTAALPFIIKAALVLSIILVLTWSIKSIVGLFKRKVGLDEVKVGWGKDTLIKTIQDSEEYWERTPTPIETLGGMSEEDLRHLLNQIAEEEVVPPVEGLGLAIAAAAVLGIGALALVGMSMGKPKEK